MWDGGKVETLKLRGIRLVGTGLDSDGTAYKTSGTRRYRLWRHGDGHFENTSGLAWTEKIGRQTFKWTEVERTEEYVDLVRDLNGKPIHQRLYADRIMKKYGNTPWEKAFSGRWVGRLED